MKGKVVNDNKRMNTQRALCTYLGDDICQPSTKLSLKVWLLLIALGSLISISGCSNSNEYAESSAELQSSQAELEEVTDDSIEGMVSEHSADITSNTESITDSDTNPSKLSVDNLSGGSEPVLGSQAADIQIVVKSC